jgi:hypothetical protein
MSRSALPGRTYGLPTPASRPWMGASILSSESKRIGPSSAGASVPRTFSTTRVSRVGGSARTTWQNCDRLSPRPCVERPPSKYYASTTNSTPCAHQCTTTKHCWRTLRCGKITCCSSSKRPRAPSQQSGCPGTSGVTPTTVRLAPPSSSARR